MNNRRNNVDTIGVLRSAIVPGTSEKHYDIEFKVSEIVIRYIGEYKATRIKQFLGKNQELQVYRILKQKRRSKVSNSNEIVIKAQDVFSIQLEKPRIPKNNTRRHKNVKDKNLVLLEIKTNKNVFKFYISSKVYSIAKRIINEFIKLNRNKIQHAYE